MSVVVRMEMPKSCWDCPCVNGEYGYCQADKEERQIEDTNERPSWCPIIAASPWHRVEEPPKEAGEYIVAYHPCYWEDVDASVTKVGIDNFRGKSAWAKKKFQRVTHWMDKPEPPKEDA